MLDGVMRKLVDGPLTLGGRWLAGRGVTADGVTVAGLGIGLLAAGLVAVGLSGAAVASVLLLSRLADGLDGAVARARGTTDFGGFLDIACDFVFYGAMPLGFILADPAMNGLPGAFLLFSFYVNGASFLGFAILAAKRGMETRTRGEKSLYFTAGLMEGTETITVFTAMVLWPGLFPVLAWVFGGLCLITAFARLLLARRTFS